MNMKKVLGISIVIFLVLTLTFILLNKSDSFYLVNQDGETNFQLADTIYAQVVSKDVVLVSIDGSQPFIPDYINENKVKIVDDLSQGNHELIIQIGDNAYSTQVSIEGGLNIPQISIEDLIPINSRRDVVVDIAGFDLKEVDGIKTHWVTLDIEVFDSQGTQVSSLSNIQADESIGTHEFLASLTSTIDTTNLKFDQYTLRATVTDQISKQSISKEVIFVVI